MVCRRKFDTRLSIYNRVKIHAGRQAARRWSESESERKRKSGDDGNRSTFVLIESFDINLIFHENFAVSIGF